MLDLEDENLATGLLSLVIALVEIIKEALVHAALGRVEGGRLSDREVERLGDALGELDEAVTQLKTEHGVAEAVRSLRHDLDQLAGGIIGAVAGQPPRPGEVEPPHGSPA